MDAPLAANSGHQGTAMALAPLAHVLYSRVMRYNPADPDWVDRDRFILSAGHASILQYAMLHLSGTSLTADDLRVPSMGVSDPGHPEAGHTPGVEVTTGPLGQGLRMRLVWRFLNDSCVSNLDRCDQPSHVGDRRRQVLNGGCQPRGGVSCWTPRT